MLRGSDGPARGGRAGSPARRLLDDRPFDARSLHELVSRSGLRALDAPVSGGVVGAKAGTLTFMVGGAEPDLREAEPLLQVMGRRVVHCGEGGTGQAAKACNNMLLGISMIGVGEAFVLAEHLGLSHQALFDVASTSSGACWALTTNCPVPGLVPTSPADHGYEPGFSVDLMLKDLRLARDAARVSGAVTELGLLAADIYERLAADGAGDRDFSTVYRAIRAASRPTDDHNEDGRMTSYETIRVEQRERVGLVTIDRPKALNALSLQVMQELTDALAALDGEAGTGCIVITGSERAFAAGADIKEMQDQSYSRHVPRGLVRRMGRARAASAPRCRRGRRLRAGWRLRAGDDVRRADRRRHRDVRPAGDQARGDARHGRLAAADPRDRQGQGDGHVPDRPHMGADEAERAGLVSRVVPADRLLEEALAVAETIAGMSLPSRDDGQGGRQPGLRDDARRGRPLRTARLPRDVRDRRPERGHARVRREAAGFEDDDAPARARAPVARGRRRA